MKPVILLAALLATPGALAQNRSHNLELVGSLPLTAINADVWGHGNFAYVGTWAGGGCPATGVKVVDISNPSAPRLVSTVAGEANTSAEDVVVRRVETAFFRGDLLVAGIQICNPALPGRRGLVLFDVTTPASPQPLGFFDTTTESRGVHELDLMVRGNRVFALLATTARFRLVEVTDPRNPVQLSDWHLTEKLGESLTGPPPLNSKFVHSALASPDGTLAVLSYWDAGAILLDIADPSSPRYLGRTGFGDGEEGNTHSVSISTDNRLLLTADEDCFAGTRPPFDDYGFLRVFDIANPRQPQQLSIFHSPNSHTDRQLGPAGTGSYCIHNPFLVGNLAFLSWYSDGVRAVDLSNPRSPQEIGWFIGSDQVWGVYVQPERENRILASDMGFGLYILRPALPEVNAGGILDAASYAATQGAGAPVAPGAIVALFGRNLAGATASAAVAAAAPGSLPTRLAGTVVTVNGAPVPLFYVSPGQINFHLPDTTPATPAGNPPVPPAGRSLVRLRVENAGRPGAEVALTVVPAAPGIFTLSQDGRGPAAALRASDQSPVTAARPARTGEVVEIFLSGLNGAAPGVMLGGTQVPLADVPFAGRAPGFTGLWQINLRVPPGLRGSVALQVTAGDARSNVVSLAVE